MTKGDKVSLTAEEENEYALLLQAKAQQEEERERLLRTLDDLDEMIDSRVGSLERSLVDVRKRAKNLEEEIQELTKPPDVVIQPPGPKSLLFVDGQAFMIVSAVVIIANIATMVLEMLDKRKEKDFFFLDQFFMLFYIVELILKAILWQSGLLFGKISVVWWNWLDLAIVVSGVLDMYVQPLLIVTGVMGKGHSGVLALVSKFMRFARLARLLRILKIVRVFLNSDLSFVAGPKFQLFIMSVIAFNCILMGFETDFPNFVGWVFVEHPLLIIFTFELIVRLRYEGFGFFYSSPDLAWNILDFIIVAGGVVDMWLMPSISLVQEMMGYHSRTKSNMGQVMTMLRMARLLRLLRLVRLMRSIPPLFHLVMGIMQAVQGMVWVLALTAVLLYAFALLAVRLIGHGLVFGGTAPEGVAEVFPAILPSMFTLFMVMNGNFGDLQPLFDALPGTELIFIAFMVLASWSVLAILTAVVSENMIKSTVEAKDQADEEEQRKRVESSYNELSNIFAEADVDDTHTLTKQEFDKMMADEDTRARLMEATSMEDDEELKRIFDWLSTPSEDGESMIKRTTFINGLQDDGAPVTERDVFRLEQQMACLEFLINKGHKELMDKIHELAGKRTDTPVEEPDTQVEKPDALGA